MPSSFETGRQPERGLFPDLVIPDLSPPEEGMFERHTTVEIPVKIGALSLLARLDFYRYPEPADRAAFRLAEPQLGRVNIELIDPDSQELAASFKTVINLGTGPDENGQYRDLKRRPIQPYALMFTRRVVSDFRRKGLAEFCVRGAEEVLRKIGDQYPELKMDRLYILTMLGSLTRALIDQNWLRQHDLAEFLKTTSVNNLGFVPHPVDEYAVRKVLVAGYKTIDDVPTGAPQIMLIKELGNEKPS